MPIDFDELAERVAKRAIAKLKFEELKKQFFDIKEAYNEACQALMDAENEIVCFVR